MIIHEITEECFKKYGKVIDSIDLTELVSTMQTVEIPADVGNIRAELHDNRLFRMAFYFAGDRLHCFRTAQNANRITERRNWSSSRKAT